MSGVIGPRLKEERRRKGLSQEDFARRGGVSRRSQIEYESGKVPPNWEYLAQLGSAGVDVFYLVTGDRTIGDLQPTESRMLDLFRRVDPEWQVLLVTLLSKVAGSGDGSTVHDIVRGFSAG